MVFIAVACIVFTLDYYTILGQNRYCVCFRNLSLFEQELESNLVGSRQRLATIALAMGVAIEMHASHIDVWNVCEGYNYGAVARAPAFLRK